LRIDIYKCVKEERKRVEEIVEKMDRKKNNIKYIGGKIE
jgi:hypothetical protein